MVALFFPGANYSLFALPSARLILLLSCFYFFRIYNYFCHLCDKKAETAFSSPLLLFLFHFFFF